MSTIEYATQFLFALQEAVAFIDKQGRACGLDTAENCGGGRVGRNQRARHEEPDHVEQCRLAAVLFWRSDRESRRDCERVERVRVKNPQRNGLSCAMLDHDISLYRAGHFGQQRRPVDRLRPWLR